MHGGSGLLWIVVLDSLMVVMETEYLQGNCAALIWKDVCGGIIHALH